MTGVVIDFKRYALRRDIAAELDRIEREHGAGARDAAVAELLEVLTHHHAK